MRRGCSCFTVAGMGRRTLGLRFASLCASLLLLAAAAAQAQQPPGREDRDEVPLERCDRLPVVRVLVDGVPRRFLVDTAATSFLNQRSFSGGRRTDVDVTSWSGATKTTALEVTLRELTLGNQTVRGLKLPAIELGRIEKACGGQVDGVIGVDLLERFGATIDLQKQVAFVAGSRTGRAQEQAAREYVRSCLERFNRADWKSFGECVDPEVVWLMHDRDVLGREKLLEFLEACGRGDCPHALPQVAMQHFWVAGDVAWFEYTYRIPGMDERSRGMAIVHRVADRWLLVNVNNSEAQPRALPAP